MIEHNILDLVPQGSSIVALDAIESHSDKTLVASLTINEESFFYEELGVPTWVGIEYMSQAIAAYAGIIARKNSTPVRIGFLVGSRRYESPCSHFELGAKLLVSVEEVTKNTFGIHVFSCKITWKNLVIQTNLSVFLPEDVDRFLEGEV